MSSVIEICNSALTKLGSNRITSLGDNTKPARVMSARYDAVRRGEIRSHRWAFAITRALLPALTDVPVFGFNYQYQLPSDQLRLDQIGDYYVWYGNWFSNVYRASSTGSDTPYAVEGGKVLTNISAPLKLRYAQDVMDPNQFDACFIESLACKLAMEACEDLTQSSTKFQQISSEYAASLKIATTANAIERPPTELAESDWILSRF